MLWGDVNYDANEDCLVFNERQTKTRSGAITDTRSLIPKAFRNTADPNRCPVNMYLIFEMHRPGNMQRDDAPFYLAVKHNRIPTDPIWYKSQAMGVNKLGSFMRDMTKAAGISGRKTNHSVRKMTTTTLLHAGYTPTNIKAITGHKNEASIANYAVPSGQQHRDMAQILLKTTE